MMDKMTHRLARTTCAAHAVPAGGARPKGRGRDRPFALFALPFLMLPAGALAQDELPVLPSGVAYSLQETVLDVKPDGISTYARFRFVAPVIGKPGGPGFAELADDFLVLCGAYALPRVMSATPPPDKIAISMADRVTELGVANPQATQFFELFRPENGRCIWEEF